jgi:hypothetical protein
MIRSTDLVDVIRQKIHNGRLPGEVSSRVFSGRGDGHPCACCGKPVRASEVEYEIDFGAPGETNPLCAMHMQCYQLWFGVLRSIELEGQTEMARKPLLRDILGDRPDSGH